MFDEVRDLLARPSLPAAFVLIALALGLAAAVPAVNAGPNAYANLPLHAVELPYGTCDIACLTQIDSAFPGGSHFVSGAGEMDPIDRWAQTGAVCVNDNGVDACSGVPRPRLVCCRDAGGCDGDWRNCDDGHVNQGECWTCIWNGACCHEEGSCDSVELGYCWQQGDEFHAGESCEEVDCVTPVDPASWGRIKALHRD